MKIYISNWSKTLFVLAALFILLFVSLPAMAQVKVSMFVNDTEILPDVSPYIKAGRTMVPIRFAAEPLGATLSWQGGKDAAAYIYKDDVDVKISIGQTTAYVGDAAVTLDAPAEVVNGRTMVPLRFVAESLNAEVGWDNELKTVYIDTRSGGDEGENENDENQDDENQDEDPGDVTDPINEDDNDFRYIGYYYDYRSLTELESFAGTMTGVIHFAYQLNADGSVNEKQYFDLDKFYDENGGYEVAKANGIDPCMLVTGFDKNVLSAVLPDSALRAKAISGIKSIIKDNDLAGIDLDFESVPTAQRSNFVLFAKELRAALGEDKIISMALMPRSADYETWLDGYDYAGLSQYADYLIIMCYNQHYAGGSPGPVASAPWVESVIKYILGTGVPEEKFILGLGVYGYDWPNGKTGSSLFVTKAAERAAEYGATILRGDESGVPYYTYVDSSGVKHQVWFEDATSMGQKAALAQEYDLAGIALWRLGMVGNDIYDSIVQNTTP